MPCYYPIEGYQPLDGGALSFSERLSPSARKAMARAGKSPAPYRVVSIPCGRCIGCRLERSRQWAVRIMHEAKCHDASCFLTLTYSDEHLPYRGFLVYRHFQDFMRRARRELGPLRFYMCGEYGDLLSRPHYHACLFGFAFYSDRVRFNETLYTSPTLDRLWNRGFASIGELTFESAAYVARYVTKKITGPAAADHYSRVDPSTGEIYQLPSEFSHMSLKPGIGATWFYRYGGHEVGRLNRCVMNGVEQAPPKYYRRLLKVMDPDSSEYLDFMNASRSRDPEDSTFPRMRDRETVTKARLAFRSRSRF